MSEKIMTECHYSEVESRSSHFHNAYEMLFIRRGSGVIEVGGQEHHVGADTLMFFSNLEEHVTRIQTRPFHRYFVKLDPDRLNRGLSTPWQLSIFKNRPQGFIPYVNVGEYAQEIDGLFRLLLRESRQGGEYSDELVLSVVRQILILTYRCEPSRFALCDQEEQRSCAQMQHWIETHFTENVQIKDITENFFISSSHFCRTFKRATGYTPKQYLMLNRVAHAKELLVHSDLRISEISRRSGFMDESNFTRYFKRETGNTPSEYRKLMEGR
ncbi:MAG: AraC family transcriptional regulator [Oscillospiraceae bacterium]|jgi:AraC-like DNA-binding protein|nr:AraC family transcriptional regulator [Oscillospiraceae bacterium]MCI9308013.1 AraC family transcriptional regulator [Oscillospiraceae bacterium]MCI9548592.1 AraC family transcriptional regulator [Oscillospiraceae bacterium]